MASMPLSTDLESFSLVHQTVDCVWLFATPWTVTRQASLSMGFSSQEHCSKLPFHSPGASSQPRDRTQVSCIALEFFTVWATRETTYSFRLSHLYLNEFLCRILNTIYLFKSLDFFLNPWLPWTSMLAILLAHFHSCFHTLGIVKLLSQSFLNFPPVDWNAGFLQDGNVSHYFSILMLLFFWSFCCSVIQGPLVESHM